MFDVLEMLPLDDVHASTWECLPPQDRGCLRLTCQQGKQLADQLITATSHDLHHLPPDAATAADPPAADDAAWRQAVASRSAFLSRLPRLTSLTLACWPSKSSLASELLVCGAAVRGGRVTQLTLRGGALSLHSLRAARLAFPQLDSLTLQDSCTPFLRRPATGAAADALEPHFDLSGPVFFPLHGAPWITKLVLRTKLLIPEAALRSLAGLATLKHLDLTLWDSDPFLPPDLLLLTGLMGLETCAVDIDDCAPAMADFSALLAATHRTRLELQGRWSGQDDRADEDPSHQARDAALELLGALSRLQSLHLSHEISVDDATFAAIRRLTQLTELYVGDILPLPAATPRAHFPLLQQLHVGWPHKVTPPPHLLRTLLPLLPLPALQGINGGPLFVDVSHGKLGVEEPGAAAWAATLHAVLHGLAAAPLLRHKDGVWFTNRPNQEMPRSLAEVVERLRPVAPGVLSCVALHLMVVEAAPCGVVPSLWPGLTRLRLEDCNLESGALPALVRGVGGTLQRLEVCWCDGPGMGEWAEVAEQCWRPLQLAVSQPGVAAEVQEECCEVQEARFGAQNIRWVPEAPLGQCSTECMQFPW